MTIAPRSCAKKGRKDDQPAEPYGPSRRLHTAVRSLSHITKHREVTMLDILGAITATAICATVVGTLIGFAPVRGTTRVVLLAAAAAWAALIAVVAALGGLAPGTMGPVPATLLPFTAILVGLFGSWLAFPR